MEFVLHLIIWMSTVAYSLFNVHLFSKSIDSLVEFKDDFSEGWSILQRSKDVSDYEWVAWKKFSFDLAPWIIIHFVGAEIIRRWKQQYLKHWYCTVSFVFIIYKFGCLSLLLFLAQPLVYFLILLLGGKSMSIWLCSCIFLIIVNVLKGMYDNLNNYRFISIGGMNDEDSYMVLVTISWIQLRCISYSLDNKYFLNSSLNLSSKILHQKNNLSLLDILSYSFYLPLVFLGPILLYEDFKMSLHHPNKLFLKKRILGVVKNVSRYIGWLFFAELCLHYIYFNALQYNIQMVNMMPDWCLYGGGLWMGLYFYLKYLVVYGTAGTLASFDYIVPETPPRCIARVHRYSQMWKYFDVGLHKFLIRYIYKPIIQGVEKQNIVHLSIMRALASLICFSFVLFWHGTHHFILIWTVLNYLGIIIESLATTISQSTIYVKFKLNVLKSESMHERFSAFLATPILIVSALSNFYFFAGSEIGDIFVSRVLNQSILSFLVMFLCLYSSCRVSQYMSHITARKIL